MYRGIQCRPLVDMDVDDGDGVAASIHLKKKTIDINFVQSLVDHV